MQKPLGLFDCSNHPNAQVPILLFKARFLNTSLNPADPPEMKHELWLATHQHRARGQDDMSLNKLLQLKNTPKFLLITPILFENEVVSAVEAERNQEPAAKSQEARAKNLCCYQASSTLFPTYGNSLGQL